MKQQNPQTNVALTMIGHFASGHDCADGQTVKTRMLAQALREQGQTALKTIDTYGGARMLPRILWQVSKAVFVCRQVMMMPASNGVQVFAPLLVLLGKPLGRKLFYVVIGGWLPELTKQKKWLAYFLKKFDGIFVETSSMKTALEAQGFLNVSVLPNFKNLPVLDEKELLYPQSEPFAFCTFSRVMKEKGIEDAIAAVTQLNTQAGRTVATLDIYGKIDDGYKQTFESLQKTFPPYISYKGVISPEKSVEILKNYFALLFPTRFATEGIPGTLIDAYAAGVPVISALWNNSQDIFIENKTGYGFKLGDTHAFFTCVQRAVTAPQKFNTLKPLCLQEAQKYTPQPAIQLLLNKIKSSQTEKKV